MDIFELHFNPKKENHTFNTFISNPQNDIEKKMGSLYMAGEITAPLLKPEEFLGRVAFTIKKSFYGQRLNPERSLSNTLKKANEFLEQEVKKENVGWLGNFNFAVLSIKDYNLVFAKTGDIKILLIRGGQISDIGKNLNLEGIDPYPVKIFFNVASGRLADNDMLLILTKDIFDFIKERDVLNSLAKAQNPSSKTIKELMPQSLFTKGEGSKVSGLAMIFLFKEEKAKLGMPMVFQPKEFIKKHSIFPVPIIVKPLKEALKKVKLPKIKLPEVKLPAVERFKKTYNLKKKIILVGGLIVLLVAGYLIFKIGQDRKEKDIITAFNQVEQKVKQAESLLFLENEKDADKILKQAYKDITPLTEKDSSIAPSIFSLKETIIGDLERLNKVEKVEDPEVVLEISGFDAQKISVSAGSLYLYNDSNTIQRIAIKTLQKESFELPGDIKELDSSSETVLAYSEPNKIYYPVSGSWQQDDLNVPTAYKTNFGLFSSYLFNLYFLDKQSCNITKYPYLGEFHWGSPKLWHEDFGKTCQNPRSMAIDGSIWVLNDDNTVTRYYTGEFQQNISFDIFPFPEEFAQIRVKDNIYILEPKNNRIIIADKNGGLIKQFRSDKLDNLKSFAVSDDEKTLYLLNGSTIYKIEL
jgi:hypothetical protein